MKTFLSNQYLVFVSRVILGVVFIVASVDKIAVPEAFAVAIQAYRLIPVQAVNLSALVVPWLELVAGVFLVAGILVRPGAVILCGLLVFFVGAMASALLRGLTIDCGCFGSVYSTPVSWTRIGEDLVLLLLGLHAAVWERSWLSLEGFLIRSSHLE
jgi:putative oxidoreductase